MSFARCCVRDCRYMCIWMQFLSQNIVFNKVLFMRHFFCNKSNSYCVIVYHCQESRERSDIYHHLILVEVLFHFENRLFKDLKRKIGLSMDLRLWTLVHRLGMASESEFQISKIYYRCGSIRKHCQILDSTASALLN